MTRHALITGGQQGIGLGIATALHAAGYCISIAAELAHGSDPVQRALAQLPGARYHQHDLTNLAAIPNLLHAVHCDVAITTFVSNAGVPARVRGDMLDITAENFDHVMDVNLRGGFFLAQAVARHMVAHPCNSYRSLTFITSVSAGMVSTDRADYCISKAAASMMVAGFATRLAPLNIGVFELRPGIIDTPMTAGVKDSYTARIAAGLVPANRWGQPADVGKIIVPIADGQMAFATGAVIPVDGGLSIARL